MMLKLPNFSEEKKLWKKGYSLVIGVDEVGRGAFAGPIVASAVAFAPAKLKIENLKLKIEEIGINDSKRLKPNQRKQLAKEIKKHALAYGIGEVGVRTINRVGIGKATTMAMRLAIANLNSNIKARSTKQIQNSNDLNSKSFEFRDSDFGFLKTFVLSDAFHIKYLRGVGLKNQKAIKKGDQKSISIAAASIIAKVFRDRLMQRLAARYKKYYWGRNKGYGTKIHQEAIIKYGLTTLHRKQFVETFLKSLLCLVCIISQIFV